MFHLIVNNSLDKTEQIQTKYWCKSIFSNKLLVRNSLVQSYLQWYSQLRIPVQSIHWWWSTNFSQWKIKFRQKSNLWAMYRKWKFQFKHAWLTYLGKYWISTSKVRVTKACRLLWTSFPHNSSIQRSCVAAISQVLSCATCRHGQKWRRPRWQRRPRRRG